MQPDDRRIESMKGLSSRDQRTVIRSVTDGRTVPDARLARTAGDYARYVESGNAAARSPAQLTVATLGFVLWPVLGAVTFVQRRFADVTIPAFFIGLGAWAVWVRLRWTRRGQLADRTNRPVIDPCTQVT
jgi:hypothetical protein